MKKSTLTLTQQQIGYLLALVEVEDGFEEESRHLAQDVSRCRHQCLIALQGASLDCENQPKSKAPRVTDDPRGTLEAIHERLDGEEWDADTCSDIAQILTAAGYRITEPEEG